MPLFFQTIMGMTAYGTGLALLPGAMATAVAMPIVPRLMRIIDTRWLLTAGALLFAWSCWALGGLNDVAGYWDVFWPRLVQGAGLGLLFVPLTTVMLGPGTAQRARQRNRRLDAVRQLGGSLGIAILTTLLARETAIAWSALASGVQHAYGQSVGDAHRPRRAQLERHRLRLSLSHLGVRLLGERAADVAAQALRRHRRHHQLGARRAGRLNTRSAGIRRAAAFSQSFAQRGQAEPRIADVALVGALSVATRRREQCIHWSVVAPRRLHAASHVSRNANIPTTVWTLSSGCRTWWSCRGAAPRVRKAGPPLSPGSAPILS